MNVCVVKEDNAIVVDGEGINFDFTLADNIWAIQWNGTSGHVEFNDATPNEELTDFSDYQYLVDAFNTEKQRLADEKAQADADALASRTYVDDRQDAYPSVGDQLDMIYHDQVDGTTTWKDAVESVKTQFPKS